MWAKVSIHKKILFLFSFFSLIFFQNCKNIEEESISREKDSGVSSSIDLQSPYFKSVTLDSSYQYLEITLNEGVYGTAHAQEGLNRNDFHLLFQQNGGTATNVEISHLKQTDPSDDLRGGESQIKAYLSVTGIPSG